MLLSELLNGYANVAQDRAITGLSLDSRKIRQGHVFIALSGSRQHGMSHCRQAINNGAVAVVYEPEGLDDLIPEAAEDLAFIAVPDLKWSLGYIAARFYCNPSRQTQVIGVTGTNGKTSETVFLSQMLEACGIIGTLGWGEWESLNKTDNTTPDALSVQKILADLVTKNKRTVAMEVSSHGLQQGRVNGVHFHGAVLTNISRDHLDYHGTMDAYVEAKLNLFAYPELAFAVVNLDADYHSRFLAAVPDNAVLWTYSAAGKRSESGETVTAANVGHTPKGIEFDVLWRGESQRIETTLSGDFNVDNVLAVLTVMLAMGYTLVEAAKKLKDIQPVPGRMERFGGGLAPIVFVDYAHTPDAVEKVLAGVKKHCLAGLWIVFGCGGDRDAGKRPQMGAIAEHWADHVILTDDNPRFEDGQAIINDILSGCRSNKIEVIRDREKAIQAAIIRAGAQDCIVIAGKGHENYQESQGVQRPFSDAASVQAALTMRSSQYAHAVE